VATDELLAEQRDYYRARAPEYDDWWQRRGRHDRGPEHTRAWRAEIAMADERLGALGPLGAVLELAAGTGNWTRRLAPRATRVTAVDSSPETLAINTAELGHLAPRVDHVVADLFGYRPPTRFDLVFMGFWLTHVPDDRFDSFWAMVGSALRPGGRMFVVDNCHPRHREGSPDPHVSGRVDHVTTRNLADGRTFDIVKRHWEPHELEDRLGRLGWRANASVTGRFFLTATGAPA
jgi:demethylmenaquinone methyltransferase/2-methoxy-6-polyprenyl-1,4-benzoquinol methylase